MSKAKLACISYRYFDLVIKKIVIVPEGKKFKFEKMLAVL